MSNEVSEIKVSPELIIPPVEVNKKKKFQRQNSKLWTLNFSSINSVAKAKILFPVLANRAICKSMGLSVLYAVEYVFQEHVIKDFIQYVTDKRRTE